jgi:hypothetical protein
MSSGGQRGIDVSGVRPMRLQNASDVTWRRRTQLVFQTFASTTGANAYLNETPNAYGSYVDFLTGRKEQYSMSTGIDCSACVGLPWQWNATRSFRT